MFFYGKWKALDEWESRRIMFFLGGPLDVLEVTDNYERGMSLK